MKIFGLLVLIASICWCCESQKHNEPPVSVASEIIFPFQEQHVHGPTVVELPNGDLLAAWFQGSGERWADDVQIMGARLLPGDSTWSAPFLMADTEDFPDINPMIFLDKQERLWLMWYPVVANLWETSIPMFKISENYQQPGAPIWMWQDVIFVKPGGKTERGIQPGDPFVAAVHQQLTEYEHYLAKGIWPELTDSVRSAQQVLWENYKIKIDSLATGKNMVQKGRIGEETARLGYPLSRRIGWQTKNKPFILDNRLIVPLYSDGLDASIFAITDDWGETWKFSNPVLGGAGIQATIAIQKDSTLVAYLRDNGPPPQRMQKTTSADKGITWTIAKDDLLPNPGSGFDMVTLSNGQWAMVYNDTEEGRNSLAVAISADEGKSWPWKRRIEFTKPGENEISSHYPAIIQGTNDAIHVVYSYHKKQSTSGHKTIKHAQFPVSWIKETNNQP